MIFELDHTLSDDDGQITFTFLEDKPGEYRYSFHGPEDGGYPELVGPYKSQWPMMHDRETGGYFVDVDGHDEQHNFYAARPADLQGRWAVTVAPDYGSKLNNTIAEATAASVEELDSMIRAEWADNEHYTDRLSLLTQIVSSRAGAMFNIFGTTAAYRLQQQWRAAAYRLEALEASAG